MAEIPSHEGNTRKTSFLRTMTGGVTGVFSGRLPFQNSDDTAPAIQDATSQEAFEAYKDFNVETNLRANRWRLYASLIDRFANLSFGAIGVAVGTMVGLAINGGGVASLAGLFTVSTAAVVGGALAVGVGLTLASFALTQFISRDLTSKGAHVQDYAIRRGAKFNAKEIATELKTEQQATVASYEHHREDGKKWQDVVAEQDAAREQSADQPRLH
tara:strand:- start:690 stop:1334 length:645 start_codon:yes stop_codon:yes gene_type:complete